MLRRTPRVAVVQLVLALLRIRRQAQLLWVQSAPPPEPSVASTPVQRGSAVRKDGSQEGAPRHWLKDHPDPDRELGVSFRSF